MIKLQPGRRCRPTTDTADRLYFQPLTFEDVMGGDRETERSAGRRGCRVLVQFPAAQTPLKLALALQEAGVRFLGHVARIRSISAEDRKRFSALLESLAITQPASGTRDLQAGSARRRPR